MTRRRLLLLHLLVVSLPGGSLGLHVGLQLGLLLRAENRVDLIAERVGSLRIARAAGRVLLGILSEHALDLLLLLRR